MKKIYRKFRQYICWVRSGKDIEYCKFFQMYGRFADGACKDCKHNPKQDEKLKAVLAEEIGCKPEDIKRIIK